MNYQVHPSKKLSTESIRCPCAHPGVFAMGAGWGGGGGVKVRPPESSSDNVCFSPPLIL